MSIPKKILTLCLVFFLGIGMGYVSEHGLSENSRFESFTENLFRAEVSANTLTLHYALADPASRGSKNLPFLSAQSHLTLPVQKKLPVSARIMKNS